MSLLDDVSIVVTPNGYKAGTLFAVKPTDALGSELVVNGDFSNGADNWTITAGATITDVATISTTGSMVYISSNSTNLVNGKSYKIKLTAKRLTGTGLLAFTDNSGNNITGTPLIDSDGELTYLFTAQTDITGFGFKRHNSGTYSWELDNISVKEDLGADMDVTRATAATRVDEAGLVNYAEIIGSEEVTNGDFSNGTTDWTVSNGAISIDSGRLKIDGTNGATAEQTVTAVIGKTYKVTYSFTLGTATIGALIITGGNYPTLNAPEGTNTFYTTATQTNLRVRPRIGTDGTMFVDNISVKEVTRDNVPRIDYSGGGCPHILAEPQRTNLYPYSDNSSTWSKSNFTTTDNYATSPDGTTNAFRGVSTSNASLLYIGSTGSSGTNTISIYAKSNTASDQKFRFFGNGNTTQSSDQTVTQEWQRFEYTETFSFITWGLAGASVSGTNDILFYGMQHEVGSYATSYIPTSGSTVTRNQDQFTRDGIGSLINSTEGVLFVEMAALSDDGVAKYLTMNDGSPNNDVRIYFNTNSNGISALLKSTTGSTQAFLSYTVTDTTEFHKIAFVYAVNRFELWVDGEKRAEDLSGIAPVGLTTLEFSRASNFLPLFAKVKQLQVYKTALTDTQLAALTS